MSNYPSHTFHARLSSTRNTISLDTGTVVTGAGTYKHDQLRNRDLENQHPVSAITGLGAHLDILDSETDRMSGDIDSLALSTGQLASRMAVVESKTLSLQNGKVDKVDGKGLSENDFTDELKEKLDSLSPGGTSLPDGGNSGDVLICTGSSNGVWKTPASSVEADNTLPITAAAVYTEVGNINALLHTI